MKHLHTTYVPLPQLHLDIYHVLRGSEINLENLCGQPSKAGDGAIHPRYVRLVTEEKMCPKCVQHPDFGLLMLSAVGEDVPVPRRAF